MNNSDYLYDLFTEEAKAVLPEAHVPASGWSPNKLLGNGTGNGTIISNNRIDATSPIYAFNMDGAIITNNRLTADGATTVVRLGNINNCQISGNVLFNATRGFTIANGIDNTQIYGNIYNGITTTIYIPSNVTAGNYSVDFTPVTVS